jgi:hypothetical protein
MVTDVGWYFAVLGPVEGVGGRLPRRTTINPSKELARPRLVKSSPWRGGSGNWGLAEKKYHTQILMGLLVAPRDVLRMDLSHAAWNIAIYLDASLAGTLGCGPKHEVAGYVRTDEEVVRG